MKRSEICRECGLKQHDKRYKFDGEGLLVLTANVSFIKLHYNLLIVYLIVLSVSSFKFLDLDVLIWKHFLVAYGFL
jgi:hypothetical protein